MTSPWRVIKTDLHLTISLNQRSITGITTLHVKPLPNDVSKFPNKWMLKANARQVIISKITVNNHNDTKYSYIDHLSGITHRTYEGGHGPTFTTKLRGQNLVKDLNARDLGTFHHTCNEAIESANQGELSIDMSKAPKTMQTTIVKIHFKLSNPETGIIFSGSDDKSKGTFKIEIEI